VHNCKPSPIQRYQIVFVLQRHHGEIGRTTSDVQKRDEQTDRQTKKLNVFGRAGGGLSPSPTNLGMVMEDLEHVLASLKLLGVWRIVSPLGLAEYLGVTRPLNLKHHNSITPRANPTK